MQFDGWLLTFENGRAAEVTVGRWPLTVPAFPFANPSSSAAPEQRPSPGVPGQKNWNRRNRLGHAAVA